jgi:hypothetical protein
LGVAGGCCSAPAIEGGLAAAGRPDGGGGWRGRAARAPPAGRWRLAVGATVRRGLDGDDCDDRGQRWGWRMDAVAEGARGRLARVG